MSYAVSISDQFTELLGSVVGIAVKVIIFLAIMLLGWFVGKWIHSWLTGLLHRIGFDRAVERGGLDRLTGPAAASDLTARLVQFAFLLFVLQLAFGIFGPNPVSDLIGAIVAWLPKLFVAVIILVVAAAVAGWVKDLIRNGLGGLSYGGVVATSVQVLILALGLIAAVNQVGVATSVTLPVLIAALATVSGIAIVGVGGGLVRPMQQRWERMLNRAEAETTHAAQQIRARRAASEAPDRNVNEPSRFDQPAYPGATTDAKPPADTGPLAPGPDETVEHPRGFEG